MSVTTKTPRDVTEHASFIVMQAWLGELNMIIPTQKHHIRFSKQLIDDKVTLNVALPLKIANKFQEVTMPVDYFEHMKFTDRNASEVPESERRKLLKDRNAPEHPVALMFVLNKKGEEFVKETAPELWELWNEHYKQFEYREHSTNLLYCLDPSRIEFKENDDILYDVDYTEGIDQFQAVYSTVWSEHMSEHFDEDVDAENTIVNMSGDEFMEYYEKTGLRMQYSQKMPSFGKPKTIRVFRYDRKAALADERSKKKASKAKPRAVQSRQQIVEKMEVDENEKKPAKRAKKAEKSVKSKKSEEAESKQKKMRVDVVVESSESPEAMKFVDESDEDKEYDEESSNGY